MKLIKKLKRLFKKPIYRRFSMFNFSNLKKNLVSLYNVRKKVDLIFYKKKL
jgi:hypothetical protein